MNYLKISLPYLMINFLFNHSANANCRESSDIISCLGYQIEHHRLPNQEEKVFNPLSYCEFNALRKDGLINNDQAKELIDKAYKLGNPILFRDAEQEVPDDAYSLNFLWINEKPVTEEGHLMGQDEKLFNDKVLAPLHDWQSMQPYAQINFWYDSKMVNDSHVEKSKQILAERGINLDKINFRSIREIPLVNENQELYEAEIAIYFRVDLTKALIADHLLANKEVDYAVNIDSDITAVTKRQLFDDKTMKELHGLGYAFGSAGAPDEENSFIILHNLDELMINTARQDESILKKEKQQYKLLFKKDEDDLSKIPKNTLDVHRAIMIEHPLEEAKSTKHIYIDHNIVYYKYKHFRAYMKRKYSIRNNTSFKSLYLGKPMIFPPSKFLSSGYRTEQIKLLREALLKFNRC